MLSLLRVCVVLVVLGSALGSRYTTSRANASSSRHSASVLSSSWSARAPSTATTATTISNNTGHSVTWGSPQLVHDLSVVVPQIEGGVTAVWSGDLNRDGRPDLVLAHKMGKRLFVVVQWKKGRYKLVQTIKLGGLMRDVTGGHIDSRINNGGCLDLLAATETGMYMIRGRCNGLFWSAQRFPTIVGVGFNGLHSLMLVDINKDGCMDAVYGAVHSGVGYYLGDCSKSPSQWKHRLINTDPKVVEGTHKVLVKDMDGDGHLDVIVASCSSGMHIFYNHDHLDPQMPWKTYMVAHAKEQPRAVCVADFNGDGLPDMAVGMRRGHTAVRVFLNRGGSESWGTGLLTLPVRTGQPRAEAYDISCEDLDDDGLPDIAVSNRDAKWGHIAVLYNNGNMSFGPVQYYPPAPDKNWSETNAFQVVDLDKDGIKDVVWVSFKDNKVGWMKGVSTPT